MATITGSTESQYWSHKLEVSESVSIVDNASDVTVDIYIGRYATAGGSYYDGANWNFTVSCTDQANKTANYTSGYVAVAAGEWVYLTSVKFTGVKHGADGKKTVTISESFSGSPSPYSGSASGNVTLTDIDRTAPTVTTGAVVNGTTSVTVSGSADVTCDSWDYQLDGGAWINFSTVEGTSASKVITVTEATHNIKVRARKKTNQVYGTGNLVNIDTIAPTVSAQFSNIGTNSFTISASANYNCNLWQYSLNGGVTWVTFSTTSSRTASANITGLSVNTTYNVLVRAKRTDNDLYGNASYSVKTQGGIVHVKANGVWKDAIPYVKINSAWKQAICYTCVNGSWRINN